MAELLQRPRLGPASAPEMEDYCSDHGPYSNAVVQRRLTVGWGRLRPAAFSEIPPILCSNLRVVILARTVDSERRMLPN